MLVGTIFPMVESRTLFNIQYLGDNMNMLAIVIAAVSSFMVGGLWYSKALFGAAWEQENAGLINKEGHPAKVFGISFAFSLVAAIAFSIWVGPAPSLEAALKVGLLAGIGFVATSFGINYQFAQRSVKLWLIDGGYHIVQFTIFGLVFGLVH